MRYYSNTAIETTLSVAVSNSTATFQVEATTGFPVSYPYTLVVDENEDTEELVEVTAAVGTTLTVTRGVDNTSPSAHDPAATVKHAVSARDFQEPQEHIADDTGHYTGDGDPVGTTDVQSLSNKDLSDETNIFPVDSTKPLGVLGYAKSTSTQEITTATEITSLSVTVTVGTSRLIKITGHVTYSFASGTPTYVQAYVNESTTILSTANMAVSGSGDEFDQWTVEVTALVVAPSAGSHTYRIRLAPIGGGTLQTTLTSSNQHFILIEDIGEA